MCIYLCAKEKRAHMWGTYVNAAHLGAWGKWLQETNPLDTKCLPVSFSANMF